MNSTDDGAVQSVLNTLSNALGNAQVKSVASSSPVTGQAPTPIIVGINNASPGEQRFSRRCHLGDVGGNPQLSLVQCSFSFAKMNSKTFTVPANGQELQYAVGQYSYVLIRLASAQVQISFDGDSFQTVSQNDNIGPLPKQHTRIYLKAYNGQAANVTILFDVSPISIQPGQTKLPPTYTKGTDSKGGTALAGGANSVSHRDGQRRCKSAEANHRSKHGRRRQYG